MNKYMLAVHPEWLVKILDGEKIFELRKRAPETPCEIYLYCTKGKPYLFRFRHNKKFFVSKTLPLGLTYDALKQVRMNGLVVAKFTLKKVSEVDLSADVVGGYLLFDAKDPMDEFNGGLMTNTECCLSHDEIIDYANGKRLLAWHISDLVIFGEPMELRKFSNDYDIFDTDENGRQVNPYEQTIPLSHAPQSYMKVEVHGENEA